MLSNVQTVLKVHRSSGSSNGSQILVLTNENAGK
jgi:hypothetical protein